MWPLSFLEKVPRGTTLKACPSPRAGLPEERGRSPNANPPTADAESTRGGVSRKASGPSSLPGTQIQLPKDTTWKGQRRAPGLVLVCEECQPCDFAVTHLGHVTRPRTSGWAASQLRNHWEVFTGGERGGEPAFLRVLLWARAFPQGNSPVMIIPMFQVSPLRPEAHAWACGHTGMKGLSQDSDSGSKACVLGRMGGRPAMLPRAQARPQARPPTATRCVCSLSKARGPRPSNGDGQLTSWVVGWLTSTCSPGWPAVIAPHSPAFLSL